MSHLIDLHFLSLLTTAAARTGSDLKAALASLDITVHTGQGRPPEVPLSVMVSLLEQMEAHAQRGRFVFTLAELFNFDDQPAVAAFLASANSLRQLHRLLEWVPALVHPAMHFEIVDQAPEAWLHPRVVSDDIRITDHPLLIELMSAVVARLSRLVAPELPIVQAVDFRHRARSSPEPYAAFFGCPVNFEAARNTIRGDAGLLDGPLPGSLPHAHAQAEETIRVRILGDGVEPPLVLEIERLLRERLALFGEGLEGMATALQLHPRTLQRRLRELGVSYAEILARQRHEQACQMLRDGSLDIDSIGIKLGYRDRRSFTQAFRQWQGSTPSAYRKAHRSRMALPRARR